MNLYKHHKNQEIARRREVVASLTLQGLTTRQIAERMAQAEYCNPPIEVAHTTVASDQQAMAEAWREAAKANIAELKANQLAEIQEAKRVAWEGKDLNALARFMKLEADICGTNAPIKVEEVAEKNAVKTLLDDLMVSSPDLYAQLISRLAGRGESETPSSQHRA